MVSPAERSNLEKPQTKVLALSWNKKNMSKTTSRTCTVLYSPGLLRVYYITWKKSVRPSPIYMYCMVLITIEIIIYMQETNLSLLPLKNFSNILHVHFVQMRIDLFLGGRGTIDSTSFLN